MNKGTLLPNNPFSGEISNVHVVYATPTNMRHIVFNQRSVVGLVELRICKQGHARTLTK
jgi:hypothetical protein